MLGLGWSQRGVCGSGHTNNAHRRCFSPKGTVLPRNIILVAGFPRSFLNSCQTQPQCCLYEIFPVLPEEAGCLFPGGHSLVQPLLPSLGSVITGIPHHPPSLFVFISFFHQNMAAGNGPDTLFTAQVNIILFCTQASLCECSQGSGSSAALSKVRFSFLP